jgi:hypothetical protein
MKAGKITCMVAATFVGTLLILGATGPVHSQPALVVQARHNSSSEVQRTGLYGDLDLANLQKQQ